MATRLQPDVDELFELFDQTLGGMDDSATPLQTLDQSFRDLFDLSVKGAWIQKGGGWTGINGEQSEQALEPPTVEELETETGPIKDGDIHWLPVRDRAGLLGLLALESRSDPSPQFLEIKTIAPFLFTYLRRNYDFSAVSGQEVYEVESKLSPTLDDLKTSEGIEEVLRSIAYSFHDVFECDNCRIFWRDSPEILRLRAETNSSDELHTTIQVDDDPIIQRVVEEEKSVIINDLPEEDGSARVMGSVRSFMAVPFRYGDRVLGTINLSSENPDVFTKDDLQRFSALSDKLASVFAVTQEYVNLTGYVEEILSNLPVGVLNLQIDEDEIHLNKTAREIFSFEDERIPRDEFEEKFLELYDTEEFLELLKISQEESGARSKRYELKRASESERRIIKALRTHVRNTEDVLSSILVVISDVTEQEELNEQVNRAERLAALGELASGLAHEIKNPLTSIHGFVQMMPDRIDDQEFMKKTSEILDRECSRLNSFIDNLLSFARPQVGHRTSFDFGEMMDDLRMLLNKRLDKSNVNLEIEIPDGFAIYGDPSKLQQVIMNLCLNSIEAIEEEGTIQIRAWNDESDSAVIELTDNGKGMTNEQIDQIFNPFFTTKDEGTGLGMAISHRIIEEHGGHVLVESEVGEGTETTIILPSKERSQRIHNEVEKQ